MRVAGLQELVRKRPSVRIDLEHARRRDTPPRLLDSFRIGERAAEATRPESVRAVGLWCDPVRAFPIVLRKKARGEVRGDGFRPPTQFIFHRHRPSIPPRRFKWFPRVGDTHRTPVRDLARIPHDLVCGVPRPARHLHTVRDLPRARARCLHPPAERRLRTDMLRLGKVIHLQADNPNLLRATRAHYRRADGNQTGNSNIHLRSPLHYFLGLSRANTESVWATSLRRRSTNPSERKERAIASSRCSRTAATMRPVRR